MLRVTCLSVVWKNGYKYSANSQPCRSKQHLTHKMTMYISITQPVLPWIPEETCFLPPRWTKNLQQQRWIGTAFNNSKTILKTFCAHYFQNLCISLKHGYLKHCIKNHICQDMFLNGPCEKVWLFSVYKCHFFGWSRFKRQWVWKKICFQVALWGT